MGSKNIAYINKDMLVWARSQTPFSNPEDVASQIKSISADELADWENGRIYPSITNAKKLAELYKLPFATFFLANIPIKNPKPYTDRRTIYGSSVNGISYALWCEIKRVCDEREMILTFFSDDDSTLEPLPQMAKTDSNEEIAKRIRKFLGISLPFKNKAAYGGKSYRYYRDIIEDKGIIVEQIEKVDISEMRGLSISYDIFPIIAINKADYDNAKTFSLFHELAHIIRRSSSLCSIDLNDADDEEEKACDSLAAEILMPRTEFMTLAHNLIFANGRFKENGLKNLAEMFGVSIIAAFRRLWDLKLINNDFYFKKYLEIKTDFESIENQIKARRKSEDIRIPYHIRFVNTHGILIPKMVLGAYSNGRISVGETCQLLSVKSKHIENITRMVMVR